MISSYSGPYVYLLSSKRHSVGAVDASIFFVQELRQPPRQPPALSPQVLVTFGAYILGVQSSSNCIPSLFPNQFYYNMIYPKGLFYLRPLLYASTGRNPETSRSPKLRNGLKLS